MSKNLSQKLLLVCGLLFCSSAIVRSQVTTNGGSGLAATYTSLDAAITALNAATITSPVVITLTAGNPQTAPSGGYEIKAEGSTVNTIRIVGNNNTITASNALASGSLTDAIFKIIGADYVSLENFVMTENAANTVTAEATNNMTEWGVAVIYSSVTNGAQNNTIKGCSISLNRLYQNTFGIYSNSNHSATSIPAGFPATSITGSNSGLKISSNAITNVNVGIVVLGPSMSGAENDGIVIGGTTPAEGNTITNFGTTGTFSAFANVSATVNGILVRFIKNCTVSNNNISSSDGGTIAGSLRGIYFPTVSTAPSGDIVNNINNNTISLKSGVLAGAVQGISLEVNTATSSTELNVNNNNFTSLGHSIAGASGAINGILNASIPLLLSISNNKFTNLNPNTTGSFTFLSSSVLMPVGGYHVVNGNSIVTAFSKTGDGGTVTLFTTTSNTPSGVTSSASNNDFSNITVVGATAIAGWISRDGANSTSGPSKSVSNNTFNNWTAGTGAITVLTINASAIGSIHTGNTVTNISSGGAVIGVNLLANENGSFSGNNINGLTVTGGVVVSGIVLSGTAATNKPNVFKNKIYNLTANNASGSVNGILVSHTGVGVIATIANNIIGDLKAPIANNDQIDVVRGISITATSTTANINVYFNTIYLNATSTGGNFSSSGIYHTQNATASTAVLDLRSNIVINTSTAVGAGASTAAFRRSAAGLDNYATTSNNNMFYAGTPSVTNNIYNNGTAYQTLTDFQTLVATRETASKTENTVLGFVSTSGANAGFLHIRPGTMTVCESRGGTGTGISDDFDGDARAGLPDIGADEFVGVVPITLASFTGTKQTAGNLLSWTTATELNNTGFELQRSADGVNFSALVFVPSKADNGNSNSNLSYSYVDKKSLATGYYRLKQIDKDGKSSLSAIVLLKGNKANGIELTSIYPNPAINNLNIVLASSKTTNVSLLISDLSGKTILMQQASVIDGDNAVKINVSLLAKGTYTIKAISNDGSETAIGKFIKQ